MESKAPVISGFTAKLLNDMRKAQEEERRAYTIRQDAYNQYGSALRKRKKAEQALKDNLNMIQ